MPAEDTFNEIFLTELIDDLYAEYEERLGLVQRDLLSLETLIDKSVIDKSLIDALLRHLHTLKGLSGTINLKPAEQLAHQLENYLRAIQQAQIKLSTAGLESLITGATQLEQIIAAHQTQTVLPDIQATLMALTVTPSGISTAAPSTLTQVLPQSTLNAQEQERFDAAIQQGQSLWHVEFVPSPALAERGINVNLIRQRLEQTGTVIQAKPLIPIEKPGFVFEFLVAIPATETFLVDGQLEGMTAIPYLPQLPESSTVATAEISSTDLSPSPAIDTQAISIALPVLTTTNLVRVDMTRLDELMRMIGELVTSRARQENLFKQLKPLLPLSQWRLLQETNVLLERQLRVLREGIMRVRMIPIGTAFERMKFVVRDLIRGTQKQVKLELQGQNTEIDKLVVDQMVEPLLHLVRNAVGHGIETTTARLAQGKPAVGTIDLRAYTAGESVIVEVADDGQGMAVDQIIAQARRQSLLTEETTLSPSELLELLCKPGFTTQSHPDLTSGRGVGMDVVRNTVSRLGGFISLKTEVGQGTRFTIQLPLTLAIVDALIVSTGGQRFAVPQLSVREVIEVEETSVIPLENNEIIAHRGEVLMLVHLTEVFGLPVTPGRKKFYVLVVGGTDGIGVVVERLLGEHEIVVQPLNDPLIQVPGVAGATELGDGQVVLILDVTRLSQRQRIKLS